MITPFSSTVAIDSSAEVQTRFKESFACAGTLVMVAVFDFPSSTETFDGKVMSRKTIVSEKLVKPYSSINLAG